MKKLLAAFILFCALVLPATMSNSQNLTANPYPSTVFGKPVQFSLEFDGKPGIDAPAVGLDKVAPNYWENPKNDPALDINKYLPFNGSWVTFWYPMDWIDEGPHSVTARAKIGTAANEQSDPSPPFQFNRQLPAVPTDLGLTDEE